MAKKRPRRAGSPPRQAPEERAAVSAERFTRLYRLVHILGRGPQTREVLARRLRLDVRGFYRDLELLRRSGIRVALEGHRYALRQPLDQALASLPFPDPLLSLGEVTQLVKGRTATHRKLKAQVDQLVR